MNREILFRGKDTLTGEWKYGFLVMLGDEAFLAYELEDGTMGMAQVDYATVGQSTGMVGLCKKPIFENDIVKQHNACGVWNDHVLSAVIFEDGKFRGMNFYHDGVENHFDFLANPKFEVIGNIHDHIHLLKGKKAA